MCFLLVKQQFTPANMIDTIFFNCVSALFLNNLNFVLCSVSQNKGEIHGGGDLGILACSPGTISQLTVPPMLLLQVLKGAAFFAGLG